MNDLYTVMHAMNRVTRAIRDQARAMPAPRKRRWDSATRRAERGGGHEDSPHPSGGVEHGPDDPEGVDSPVASFDRTPAEDEVSSAICSALASPRNQTRLMPALPGMRAKARFKIQPRARRSASAG
jgi:hypothetical protein